ncbi:hypothetical protein [Glutamicibacter nicotianae]|uniref:hypothetical protein n=1 Tax=Glutamicibacter nicotianae TaxID=37929 RepID=UPI0025539A43|nr:hypothetical protein [Glutamicibacter nicotianae]WIV44547.1 hypothetical protein QQS42_02705 [Glutamicibacter nicotianae]
MKTKLAGLAVVASLALVGCSPQAIEFEAAPETMPAIADEDIPTPSNGPDSWNPESIEYFGASAELEASARETAQAIHDYSEENPDTPVAQLSLMRASAKRPGNIELRISNDLSAAQMKQSAKATACAIAEEKPDTLSVGNLRLAFLTLISETAGEVYTFSDTQLCE